MSDTPLVTPSRDALATALGDAALENYEAGEAYIAALATRDPEVKRLAEARLRASQTRHAQVLGALVASRQPPVSFVSILNDPTQQLDPDGEVMRSIRDYQNATTTTASANPETGTAQAKLREREECKWCVIVCPSRGDTMTAPFLSSRASLEQALSEIPDCGHRMIGACRGCTADALLASGVVLTPDAYLAGLMFRVETACDGYASLTVTDVPDEYEPEDYIAGATEAARQIAAALATPHAGGRAPNGARVEETP